MFNKDGAETSIKDAETIIGQSVKVKGNFHGQGNIVIEGTVEGSVKTNKDLFVGEKAVILAEIHAKNANISGKIQGNVKVSDFLEIKSSATITGDIEAAQISIEKGARLNGHCSMDKGRKETEDHK